MTEQDAQKLNTGRLLRAEADVILPMLNERREVAITKILQCYRSGDFTKLPSAAAELCVTEDMKIEIKNKIRSADALERKINGSIE